MKAAAVRDSIAGLPWTERRDSSIRGRRLERNQRGAIAMDPVVLSRIQFAWVIAWHFLLPAFTIGLAAFIAVLEGLNLFTEREIYLRISTFWIKIFAVSFGMGVVSGIVMPFQIGTNWSRYSDATANVVGPLL